MSNLDPSDALTFEVTEAQDGERLDRFLASQGTPLSRSRLKALILEGAVTLDGAVSPSAARKVRAGQEVQLDPPAPQAMDLAPEPIPLSILFEDDAYLIIDKPAGLVVHPGAGNPSGTLVNALLHHCGPSLEGIGGVRRPGIVHRIDKETSGLLVVAKTQFMHAGLVDLFSSHKIERSYLALVYGAPPSHSGRIETQIGRSPQDRKRMAVLTDDAGKKAVTHYKTLERFQGASLVECRLETGRTHQIRVHMTHLRCPLIGDPVYGRASPARIEALERHARDFVASFPRQALHAGTLGFERPDTGETVHYSSEVPEDFQKLRAMLSSL